ncbi:serine/threonine-protein kinase [Roseateles sp. SL47]|uniref:serine/threonine protein kinase n=1 Tax=Roseateles sp. SL47 TaxID=2995138 RepID=UPI002271F575|nr:serine/threonine-protein kinase [Roseateles sp. SL47]WAC73863.1 serine/threonine-protein kinase [Roseateles sp. SL47]
MEALDKERWIALSPLLDQLLDQDEEDRQRWLAQLRAHDAATADELEALLAKDKALHEQNFLGRPAAEQIGSLPDAAPAQGTAAPDLSGQSIGPYQLEREVGQGGMGAVWLAHRADGRFQGEVAIKFLKAGLFGQGDNGRFAREGQILGRLSHPHIARLLDAGVHQGHQPYLVLEYVDGLPIDRYCHVHGLDIEARIRLFLDVLAAVAHAHQRLILHRDLKPSNILVTADGQVKLLDFGIAKLMDDATQPAAATELTQRAGSAFTPQYAAPEQIQQGDVTTATDVYALGVLLYQLLGGRHPTADDTQTHLDRLKAVVELVPKRLSEVASGQLDPVIARQAKLLKGDLDTIVAKALKKSAAERYTNAEQFSADLYRWLAHEPIAARPDTRFYVLGRFVRRHRLAVGASSLAVLALVGMTTLSVVQAHRAELAERQAQQRRHQADDLLSFMLGEFADKLRPIGRLELLDSVGTKALSYLARDDATTLQERLQRAKALTVLGEVRVSKRDLDGALIPLAAALKLLEGPPPADPTLLEDWYKSKGAAAFWEGHSYFSQRNFAKASEAMKRYRLICKEWLTAIPNSKDALAELSYAENSVGSVSLDMADFPGAISSFESSIQLKKRAIANADSPPDPSLRLNLADSLSWLGTTLYWEGKLAKAAEAFEQAIAEVVDVRKTAPGNGTWAYREAVLRRWLGGANSYLGRTQIADQQFAQSLTILRALSAEDPSNLSWGINLLLTESLQLRNADQEVEARNHLPQWKALKDRWDELDKRFGPATRRQRLEHQFLVYVGLANALANSNETAASVALLLEVLGLLRTALDSTPNDTHLLGALAEAADQVFKLDARMNGELLAQRRVQICGDLVDRIEKMRPLIGVHLLITSSWVQAQSCLGRGGREDVQREAAWLTQQRAASSSVLTPDKPREKGKL